MTEHEWLMSEDSLAMLRWITCFAPSGDGSRDLERWRNRPSDRKLQFFAIACCERYGIDCPLDPDRDNIGGADEWATAWCRPIIKDSDGGIYNYKTEKSDPVDARPAFLREIFGNPWRPVSAAEQSERECVQCRGRGEIYVSSLVPFQPSTLAYVAIPQITTAKCNICEGTGVERVVRPVRWLTPTVTSLAKSIYDSRDFSGMPALSDALEEAGCTEESLLRHCRGQRQCTACLREGNRNRDQCECRDGKGWVNYTKEPACGPHVLGCHVLDLLLGIS